MVLVFRRVCVVLLGLPARYGGFAGSAVTSQQGVVAATVKPVRRAGGPGRGSRHRFCSKGNSVFDARCFARRAGGYGYPGHPVRRGTYVVCWVGAVFGAGALVSGRARCPRAGSMEVTLAFCYFHRPTQVHGLGVDGSGRRRQLRNTRLMTRTASSNSGVIHLQLP